MRQGHTLTNLLRVSARVNHDDITSSNNWERLTITYRWLITKHLIGSRSQNKKEKVRALTKIMSVCSIQKRSKCNLQTVIPLSGEAEHSLFITRSPAWQRIHQNRKKGQMLTKIPSARSVKEDTDEGYNR